VELHSNAGPGAAADRSPAGDNARPGQSPADAAGVATWFEMAKSPLTRAKLVIVLAVGDLTDDTRAHDPFLLEQLAAAKRKHKHIALWHAGAESPAIAKAKGWAKKNKVPFVPFGMRFESMFRHASQRFQSNERIGVISIDKSELVSSTARSHKLPLWEA
jgi:hypothetical protein